MVSSNVRVVRNARYTHTLGRQARLGLRNKAQTATRRMRILKEIERKRPSQAAPQACSLSGHITTGRSRKTKGVASTSRPTQEPTARGRYRRKPCVRSCISFPRPTTSSWEMLSSDVPVTAVVVSPQLSSWKKNRDKRKRKWSLKALAVWMYQFCQWWESLPSLETFDMLNFKVTWAWKVLHPLQILAVFAFHYT